MSLCFSMAFCATTAAEFIEARAHPRNGILRRFRSMPWRLALWMAFFGFSLFLIGSAAASACIIVMFSILISYGSNLKFKVLQEPLVFSDASFISAIFQFPELYLFAAPLSTWLLSAIGLLAFIFETIASFVPHWRPHLEGLLIFICGASILWTSVPSKLMRHPALNQDISRHGVPLTSFLYWQRWMATRQAALPTALKMSPSTADIIIIVQNESFCDPQDILACQESLPNLAIARSVAWTWGNLEVSCFGGYTMRTEYGVLCGLDESMLGFSKYNPYLIAGQRPELALPTKFAKYHCIFLHPYHLQFFGREELMKRFGFAELMGASAFASPKEAARYIPDSTLTHAILQKLADRNRTLLYTVTMENHGPWQPTTKGSDATELSQYLHHLANADAMLGELMDALIVSGRSAVLAFFGDHRPSISGCIENSETRHTPYVLLRFDHGKPVAGPGRLDRTPAALHDAIRACSAISTLT